jgi:transcriptional regulator
MKGEATLSLREDGEELSQTEMLSVAPWWKRSFQDRCARCRVFPKHWKIPHHVTQRSTIPSKDCPFGSGSRKTALPIVIRVEYKGSCVVIRGEGQGVVLKRPPEAGDILQGTLDMLILRTLVTGPAHGHTIAQVIEHTSENALDVEQGSLYPALHRLEDRGWLASQWGVSENNRRAKFYQLTAKGRKELAAATGRWRRMTRAIGLILGEQNE